MLCVVGACGSEIRESERERDNEKAQDNQTHFSRKLFLFRLKKISTTKTKKSFFEKIFSIFCDFLVRKIKLVAAAINFSLGNFFKR